MALFGLVIVVGNTRSQLYLTDIDLLLMFAGGFGLLLLLVLVFGVIEDSTDWWLRPGRYLDQIEVSLSRVRESLLRVHDALLFAHFVDHAHLGDPDLLVDPGRIALRRTAVEAGSPH